MIKAQVVACLFAVVAATFADVPRSVTSSPVIDPAAPAACPPRLLVFRSLMSQVDNHVVANLLTEIPMRQSELPLSVVAGEITRCESESCVVPVTLRVSGAEGPVTLAFAVSNARGQLSEVHHAECGSGSCSLSLKLERGHNTVSVGVIDVLSQMTAYTTLRINAERSVASRQPGKTEWF
jgi:hypothetical protein